MLKLVEDGLPLVSVDYAAVLMRLLPGTGFLRRTHQGGYVRTDVA
jgi:hypothetical protein